MKPIGPQDMSQLTKLVKVMEFQLSYFNLKRWCCESAAVNKPANLENSAVATGLEKVSFHSNPKESNAKECSDYPTIALITHANKVMLKILQVRLQQLINWQVPYDQAGFTKGRGTRDQINNIHCIIGKAREIHKDIYFCPIDYTKAFACVDHNKLWKILQEMGIPDYLTCSGETCMQVKKQQLELDMEQ